MMGRAAITFSLQPVDFAHNDEIAARERPSERPDCARVLGPVGLVVAVHTATLRTA